MHIIFFKPSVLKTYIFTFHGDPHQQNYIKNEKKQHSKYPFF